jgi:hypothetical protein
MRGLVAFSDGGLDPDVSFWQSPAAMLRALKRAEEVDREKVDERRKPTVERRLQDGTEANRRLADELARIRRRR